MRSEPSHLEVDVLSGSLVTPLGTSIDENLRALREGRTGIRLIEDPKLSPQPFYGGPIDDEHLLEELPKGAEEHPRFEQLCILAAEKALHEAGVHANDPSLLLVIATTKGNIDLLDKEKAKRYGGQNREYLFEAGKRVAAFLGHPQNPLLLSNACISGVQAIDVAATRIRRGHCRKALVIGGDILSKFTVSGFQAFLALGSGPCKPYDEDRDGLNLGEGAAALLLGSSEKEEGVAVLGGASSNDANHISGPSRTGEGLASAIERALHYSATDASSIDHLNAHGTATPYNDEMEAKAFNRCGLQGTRMNSYKGAFGHTLGAAGTIETALTVACMQTGESLPSIGYRKHGVSLPLEVLEKTSREDLKYCLKTASGFGGGNAALVLRRT